MSDESVIDTQVAEHAGKPPRSFYIIGSIALAWNIIGVLAYISQVTMSDEVLATLPEARREMMLATPSWVIAIYALATNTGALGSLLLLFRKMWAVPVLIFSLACILAQMGYSLLMTEAIAASSGMELALSGVVIVVGIFLVWYSRGAAIKGWIS